MTSAAAAARGIGLVSGEGVRLELATATVASRLLAAVLDLLVQGAALSVTLLVTGLAAGGSDEAGLAAILITEAVLILAGYPVVVEWLTRGKTLGKMALGLRVVRDDGGPIGLRHALVRGLASLVLEKPGLVFPFGAAAGAITLTFSGRDKRIGDLMAGTVVLNERAAPMPQAEPPMWVPVPLQGWALSLDLQGLDDRLALQLRQFVARAHAMSAASQYELGEQLRTVVLSRVRPAPPRYAPTAEVLMSVLAERRRRAVAGETGPWRRAPAATVAVHRAGTADALPPPPATGPFAPPG